MSFTRRSTLLAFFAAVFFVVAALNALEYFFAGRNWLSRESGVVSDVKHETYVAGSGKYGSRYYSKTRILLADNITPFELKDRSDEGGYVPVEKGDTIVLFVKRWFQNLYIYTFDTNIFYVEKDGSMLYNNLAAWKGAAFGTMCLTGGLSFFLLIIFLAVAKNISVEHWFQSRILKNPKYMKRESNDPSLK